MKPIRIEDKIRRKYQKKGEYLLHFQLFDYFLSSMPIVFSGTALWLMLVYIVNGGYPKAIATFDITLFCLGTLFFLYIKPRLLKGKVKGYYRRDYNDIRYILLGISFIVQGAMLRTPIFMGLYGLNWYFADTVYRKAEYLRKMKSFLINPQMSLIALILFIFTIYLIFYSEKYVTIREFSNSVVKIMQKTGLSEEEATRQFILDKDRYYNICKLSNIKYDYDEDADTEVLNYGNNQKIDKNETAGNAIQNISKVRRKSRI